MARISIEFKRRGIQFWNYIETGKEK